MKEVILMDDGNDLAYEQYRLGELTSEECRRLEALPGFDARMAELDESDREILARYPSRAMAEAIDRKAEEENRGDAARVLRFPSARRVLPLTAAAAVVLAAVIAFPLIQPGRGGEDSEDVIRPKGISVPENNGTPVMALYRSNPDGVEVLRDGDLAVEHDLLQVGFTGGGAWWGSILSVDGNGFVTRHWPLDGDDAVPLGHNAEYLLPYAYELDDAPSFEAFFLIWSDAGFDVRDAETLLAGYTGQRQLPPTEILNPGGKTGLSVIQILKSP